MDEKKFPILVSHISDMLENQKELSPEEINKLESSLKLNSYEVQLLISTVQYLLTENDKYVIKPSVLHSKMMSIGINESKVEPFIKIWMKNNKELLEDLCTNDLNKPTRLEDFKWQLSLQVCSTTKQKQKLPTAMMQFVLSKDGSEDLCELEMNHEQLSAFYNQLENIQQKLDAINS